MKFICNNCGDSAEVRVRTIPAGVDHEVRLVKGKLKIVKPEAREASQLFYCTNCSTEVQWEEGGRVSEADMPEFLANHLEK